MIKRFLSWWDIERDCDALSLLILSDQNRLSRMTGIFAVSRGGLVPGAILAYKLGFQICDTISTSSWISSLRDDLLVVDDIADTGVTFQNLRHSFPRALFISLYVKPKGKLVCDYWVSEIPQDVWVVFPWAPNDVVNR